ncbi:uncharacterized protein LOC100680036 isoform X1 [Nasonia vitripennis]|uniref:Uncharacterized protein n=1 Tax=Nasonia vitripennis TaxID=7425 RepID=A0A7M7QIP4_NASVI|nr:uncharacterized protein LOC100680036 isoform X1 [Nasonia vitripennis]XP_031787374.1 uncharacterized protein LOC100680036 isoform X1 [Nasonia vitripennis]
MTELLIGLSSPTFNGVSSVSKPPEVVFRTPGGAGQLFRNSEMRHSRSEDLLGPATNRSPSPPPVITAAASEDDLVAASALSGSSPRASCSLLGPRAPGSPGMIADRLDPEDSIRDIVTENDLYRFVLFKRHYDKYVALATRYEEARGLAYYLEERYHEVKAERDKLEETRQQLERRLEGCEAELKDKEEELFLQLERSLRLEDEVERARQEREACLLARERLEREQAAALRQLQIQAAQNEITRRSLERARLEVIRQATVIRAERDALERENEALKEKLRVEQDELGEERRRNEEGVAALTHEATTLRHAARHLRAAALHATSCRRRRRCSVCLYARRTFQDVDDFRDEQFYVNNVEHEISNRKYTKTFRPGKLFKCLQAPIQDLRTWLRPSTPAALPPLRTSSPLERGISYIDDSGTSSEDEAYSNTQAAEVSLSSTVSSAPPTTRAFSSDSGFSSETGDRRSRSYECGGSSRKISESSSSEPGDALGQQSQRAGTFTRSRWTSSFRKLLGRKSKAKANATAQPESAI